ncbi:SRPBCC family protein [Chitinophaga sp. S165]|uniref:SRPBCC family protein n=1 Tax=Chitinophaga sp. S165 TaxID=2135462 RepID=UPI000D7092E9|nr:SRPBCC family protein [Chitinophaga sp. S165]PWV51439.1 polyketide cyclase/dehydrase/lipid transport protein [Chitinophaga sp. S165]
MRFIKLLLLSALCFGVLIFLISLLLPSKAIVERSGVIDAPLPIVYSEINNLNTWPEWNPWAAPGVASNIEYSNPAVGQGAYYTWSGMQQEKPVSGKVFIRESAPSKGVFYNMEFNAMKPISAAFDLKPSVDGKGTVIRWRLETHLGLLPWWKLRGFLADKLTGPQLEDGLTKLKSICEKKK